MRCTAVTFDTDVIAHHTYTQMFTDHDSSRASAIATLLLIAIVPVTPFNLRRFRAQEAMR